MFFCKISYGVSLIHGVAVTINRANVRSWSLPSLPLDPFQEFNSTKNIGCAN